MFRKRGLLKQSRSFVWYGIPILLTLAYAAIAGAQTKVQVCHFPPDDPTNFRAMAVNLHALPAHLAHGDFIGPCECPCWTAEQLKTVPMTCGDCGSAKYAYAKAVRGSSGEYGCAGLVVAETSPRARDNDEDSDLSCHWNPNADGTWDLWLPISSTQWYVCFTTLSAELVERGYCE